MVRPSFKISKYNKFLQDNVACLRLLQLLFAHSREKLRKQSKQDTCCILFTSLSGLHFLLSIFDAAAD